MPARISSPEHDEGTSVSTDAADADRPMTTLVLVMGAGALGVGVRYGLGLLAGDGAAAGFPYATLGVNVVGAIAIGVLVALLAANGHATSGRTYATVGIGLLGGFTTASAFALEAVTLLEDGALVRAAAYVTATNVLTIAGCWLGLVTTRAFT